MYYRINVIPIILPPLSERREDIYSISKHFLNKYALRMNKNITEISDETIDALRNYSWPGNIRELENSIEYAVNVETSNMIMAKSLPNRVKANMDSPNSNTESPKSINDTIRDVEINEIINAMNKFGWNTNGKQAAANHLGISVATLYRRMKKVKMSNL